MKMDSPSTHRPLFLHTSNRFLKRNHPRDRRETGLRIKVSFYRRDCGTKRINRIMNSQLIPLNVSIRKDQLEQKRKQQKEQINKRWNEKRFYTNPEPSDKRSAFRDNYISSAYAKVRTNQTHMKNDMVHATHTSPYTKSN